MNPLVDDVASPPIAEADSWLMPAEHFPDMPLLNLAQGVPSYPPAMALREEMARLALLESSARYTPIMGVDDLRSRLAEHLSETYAASISGRQIAITAGCNQAYCTIVQALAGPGDDVILTVPYYFNQHMWLQMQGIRAQFLHCDSDTALPSVEHCAEMIGPRTRALVLVSPNNPTGAIYSPALIDAFYALARSRGITLILDETYKDFLPDGARPHALFDTPEWDRHFVSLHSFSKSFSMTGYRVGAVVTSEHVLRSVEKILDCVTICPSNLSQRAAEFALRELQPWREKRCGEMVARAQALRSAFTVNALRYELLCAGGFFGYVRHPFQDASSLDVAKHLARVYNLLCLPGTMFGPGQEAYLRLSFTNVSEDRFDELIARLVRSQDSFCAA